MSKETKNEVKQEETNYEELYVKEKIRAANLEMQVLSRRYSELQAELVEMQEKLKKFENKEK